MGIQLARAVCRDPEPGEAGPALERIDLLLAAAEQLALRSREQGFLGFALMMAASTIAATERIAPVSDHRPITSRVPQLRVEPKEEPPLAGKTPGSISRRRSDARGVQ